jgi:hypothetical protein
MGFQSDAISSYLHRPSGRALPVSDEAVCAAADSDRSRNLT